MERLASDTARIWAESCSTDGTASFSISAVKDWKEAEKREKSKSCQKLLHCPFFSWLPVPCIPRHQTGTPHLPVLKRVFLSCAPPTAQFALIQPDDHCVAQPQSTDTRHVMLSRVWPGIFVQKFPCKPSGLAIFQWWPWHREVTACHLPLSSVPSPALHVPKLLMELPLALTTLSI